MLSPLKRTAAVILLAILPAAGECADQTITNCDGGDAVKMQAIQSKVNAANAGEEVFFDCASGSFTGTIAVNKGITIRGRGQTTVNNTTSFLTKLTASGAQIFNVTVPDGATFRLTGIEFAGDPGEPLIDLNGHFASLRVDHCGFTNIEDRAFRLGYYTRTGGAIEGLFDHNVFTSSVSRQFLLYYGNSDSWLKPELYGTDKALYFEDNVFSWGESGPNSTPCDGEHGARFVIRRNTFTNAQLQWHDTGSTHEARSTRHFEIYDNTMKCTKTNCGWGPVGFRGGTGVFYNNTIPYGTNGYENGSVSEIYRDSDDGSFPWENQCDNVADPICSDFLHTCPSGSGCPSGTTCLTSIDGQRDSLGWPCRDQTGRGQDDPVSHVQRASPMYWWGNKTPSGARLDPWMANDDLIKPNRDYYQEVGNFNGSAGVGVGPLSARPAACRGKITDPDGFQVTGGVGYWATDQNRLYHCTATNTWEVLFTPYQYPHRLQGGGAPGGSAPSAPSNLRIQP